MSEVLRYAQLNALNESEPLLDLNDEVDFFIKKETFKVVAGVKQPVLAQDERRWGGSQQVGETTENAEIEWTAGVSGDGPQECIEKVEELLAQIEASPLQLYVEWQAEGVSEPTLYEVRGTGVWTPEYEWEAFSGAELFCITVRIPVAPLAKGLPIVLTSPAAEPTGLEEEWIPGGEDVGGIVVNGTYVYWTNLGTGDIGRAKLNGTEVNQKFITGCSSPGAIALDGTYLYWKNTGTSDIGRATLAGGSVNQAFISGVGASGGLAVNATHIYWTVESTGHIGRATIAGGTIETSWIITPASNEPCGIAVNADYVYWANWETHTISRATIAGTEVELAFILNTKATGAVALDSNYIYWATPEGVGRAYLIGTEADPVWVAGAEGGGRGVAISETFVYWDGTSEAVARGELIPGGEPSLLPAVFQLPPIPGDAPAEVQISIETGNAPEEGLLTGLEEPRGIAVDGTYIYWTNASANTIGRAELDGGNPEPKWITGCHKPEGICVTATHVYWINEGVKHIGRATIAGGTIEREWVATENRPAGIAVDSTHVYWINEATDYIGRCEADGASVNQTFLFTGGGTSGVAVKGGYIYWSRTEAGTIGRATTAATGSEPDFITGADSPVGLVASERYLYWTNTGDNTIGRAVVAALGASEINQTWLLLDAEPFGIAISSGFVYWTIYTTDSIGRATLERSPPIWALLSWAPRPTEGLAPPPFGLLDSSEAECVNWVESSEEGGDAEEEEVHNGYCLFYTGTRASAAWSVDPATMMPDSFSGELAVEVWARVSAVKGDTLTLTLSAQPEDGLGYGAPRYTDEWGSGGRPVPAHTGAGNAWRMTRLGTLHLLVNPLAPRVWKLNIEETCPESQELLLDYLLVNPVMARACSPSGKPNNSSYPPFIINVGPTVKTILPDLSALIAKPGKHGHPDHGLGGQLLQLPPGETNLLVKLSSLVPDDPTVNSTTEQLQHHANVSLTVTPRYFLARTD